VSQLPELDQAAPVACLECRWRGPLRETDGDPGDLARCPRCALPVLREAVLRWVEGGRPPDGYRDGRPVYLLPPEFFARRHAR
jgi:hypothetical protein